MGHAAELASVYEFKGIQDHLPGEHYAENGSCDGPIIERVLPTRLRWDITPQCIETIQSSYGVARALADTIDLVVVQFLDFGSGYIKRQGFSPDAFVQMALQLAYLTVCSVHFVSVCICVTLDVCDCPHVFLDTSTHDEPVIICSSSKSDVYLLQKGTLLTFVESD
ncbi:hypothetical protein AHF37_11205 [Paragonimus kellicotti]|nr:hypothetical protein AHF37_11205 [Paragonimus kellicotti]